MLAVLLAAAWLLALLWRAHRARRLQAAQPTPSPSPAQAEEDATSSSATSQPVARQLHFTSPSASETPGSSKEACPAAALDAPGGCAELGTALGAATGAVLGRHLTARFPPGARLPLARRVAMVAPQLARSCGTVLAEEGLLPDRAEESDTEEEAVPSGSAATEGLREADGRQFVAAFCSAFEAAALLPAPADAPAGGALAVPSPGFQLTPLATAGDHRLLATRVLQIALHAATNNLFPSEQQMSALMLALHATQVTLQAGSAEAKEQAATSAAARLHEEALDRAAADALSCAALVAASLLIRRVVHLVMDLPNAFSFCSEPAPLGWRTVLAPHHAAASFVECLRSAFLRALFGIFALMVLLPAAIRWMAAPSGGDCGGLRRTLPLLLTCAVLLCGGSAACRALGGIPWLWALGWAPLCMAHCLLRAGLAEGASSRLRAGSREQQVAAWLVAAAVWPAVFTTLPFV